MFPGTAMPVGNRDYGNAAPAIIADKNTKKNETPILLPDFLRLRYGKHLFRLSQHAGSSSAGIVSSVGDIAKKAARFAPDSLFIQHSPGRYLSK